MASRGNNRGRRREANVVLELRMAGPVSEEALDDKSDVVLEVIANSASDIALGPAIALSPPSRAIELRFDVLGANDAEIHKRIAKVVAVVERETDLLLTRTSVEAVQDGDGASIGSLVAA